MENIVEDKYRIAQQKGYQEILDAYNLGTTIERIRKTKEKQDKIRMKLLDPKENLRRQERNRKSREARMELKVEVLSHYGNDRCACVQCGESRLACLSIDHIIGGGEKHRRAIKRGGSSMYRWLRDNNYPSGYQTLCMNCQFLKRVQNDETRNEGLEPLDWQHYLEV